METFIFLGWARIRMLSRFSKLAPSLGERWQETDSSLIPEHIPAVWDVAGSIQLMSKYTPWKSKCLVRALAGMKMLERRGIGSTLYLGTSKDEKGSLIAHAWLRSGPYYVSGAEVMKKFVTVDKYANRAES